MNDSTSNFYLKGKRAESLGDIKMIWNDEQILLEKLRSCIAFVDENTFDRMRSRGCMSIRFSIYVHTSSITFLMCIE